MINLWCLNYCSNKENNLLPVFRILFYYIFKALSKSKTIYFLFIFFSCYNMILLNILFYWIFQKLFPYFTLFYLINT